MDEPLSNLDAKLRVQMRAEISRIQRQLSVTTVYVTHDQIEAMTMGDRVAVLRRGLLQQFDAPQRLYEEPANLFVASFIGSPAMNILEGTVEQEGDGVVCRVGSATLRVDPALARFAGRTLAIGIRPEALGEPGRWPDAGTLRGKVQTVEALGPEQLVHVEIDAKLVLADHVLEGLADQEEADDIAELAGAIGAAIVARLDSSVAVRPDDPIELAVDLRRLHFFDPETGEACR
jgi:multiple sugar transport system ATP-binding protein